MSTGVHSYKFSLGDDSLSRFVFEEQFNAMKLSIFKPRKDQCDLCISYKEGNIDYMQYFRHCEKKERT